MIHFLPLLRLPWQRKHPATAPQTFVAPLQPPERGETTRPVPEAAREPFCWNCGCVGATLCPGECPPPPERQLVGSNLYPFRPTTPEARADYEPIHPLTPAPGMPAEEAA